MLKLREIMVILKKNNISKTDITSIRFFMELCYNMSLKLIYSMKNFNINLNKCANLPFKKDSIIKNLTGKFSNIMTNKYEDFIKKKKLNSVIYLKNLKKNKLFKRKRIILKNFFFPF